MNGLYLLFSGFVNYGITNQCNDNIFLHAHIILGNTLVGVLAILELQFGGQVMLGVLTSKEMSSLTTAPASFGDQGDFF